MISCVKQLTQHSTLWRRHSFQESDVIAAGREIVAESVYILQRKICGTGV